MAWRATPEGQRDAYRRDEHVLPSQFADRAAWDAYLDGLRQHKPATLDDVRPRLAGVNLVAEIEQDFLDPSRITMRLPLRNGDLQPATRHLGRLSHGLLHVRLPAKSPTPRHCLLHPHRGKPFLRAR